MSAELEFKQLIDRILRCREAEDEAKADTKEVYAELKARGYDKTAAGALVAELRKKDKNPAQFEERNATLDLYRDVYERASHAHTREGREVSTQGSAAVEARAAHNREVAGSTPAPATNSVSVQSQDAAVVSAPAESAFDTISAPVSDADVPALLGNWRNALRPNCRHPENCAGYGSHTCHSCRMAALAESEVA